MLNKKFLTVSIAGLCSFSLMSSCFSSAVKEEIGEYSNKTSQKTSKEVLAREDGSDVEDLITRFSYTRIAPRRFFLERHVRGKLLAQYTDTIQIRDKKGKERSFDLNRQSAIEKQQIVNQLRGHGQNHLIAQGICYSSDGGFAQPLTLQTLPKDQEKTSINDQLVVDWVSVGGAPLNKGYFSRVANTWGGHSASQFIEDIEALWVRNHEVVLELLLPYDVIHGNQDVYMAGLELFSSLDMCSEYYHIPGTRNRYDCLGKLVNFRKRHQEGQRSISERVRNLLGDRFVGDTYDKGFSLIYHAGFPYSSADYNAVTDDNSQNYEMSWTNDVGFLDNYIGLIDDDYDQSVEELDKKYLFQTKERVGKLSFLSQHRSVNATSNVVYSHIHSLTGEQYEFEYDLSSFMNPEHRYLYEDCRLQMDQYG